MAFKSGHLIIKLGLQLTRRFNASRSCLKMVLMLITGQMLWPWLQYNIKVQLINDTSTLTLKCSGWHGFNVSWCGSRFFPQDVGTLLLAYIGEIKLFVSMMVGLVNQDNGVLGESLLHIYNPMHCNHPYLIFKLKWPVTTCSLSQLNTSISWWLLGSGIRLLLP